MTDLNLMQGAPPESKNQVTLENWRLPPFNKWSFQHVCEIVQTAPIYNDPENIRALESSPSDLINLKYNHGNETHDISDMFERTQGDGLIVLHEGKIVLEEYRNGMTVRTRHILFSVTKSVTSLIAGILVGRGQLDPEALVTKYIPEAADTAFGGAKVQNVLDMSVGIAFDEDYTATKGAIVEYRESSGWNPRAITTRDLNLRDFLLKLKDRSGNHGEQFSYKSPVTDLLGWILERASGKRFADLLSEELWQPMGAGFDAYMCVDGAGAPRTAGGLCATLRDLALIGQLVCDGGKRDAVQIVPEQWITDIRNNGDRSLWMAGDFANYYTDWRMRYRSKWYVMGEGNSPVFGVGIHGQFVYINPEKSLVVAQFSSQPDPEDIEKEVAFLHACEAISNNFIQES